MQTSGMPLERIGALLGDMMKKHSAGILVFRHGINGIELMLVHPGGPFWARRDAGSWSIPKGLIEKGEGPLDAAKREFREETGFEVEGSFMELGEFGQPSGKVVHAWAVEGNFDESKAKSNTFTLEWPKNSGVLREFPEVDEAGWFNIKGAKRKILKGQLPMIGRLEEMLDRRSEGSSSSRDDRYTQATLL